MAPRRIEISPAEILEALNDAARPKLEPDPPGFFVVSELVKSTGVCQRQIRNRLEVARSKNRVEQMKVWRRGSDGRLMRVSAYKILPEKKP